MKIILRDEEAEFFIKHRDLINNFIRLEQEREQLIIQNRNMKESNLRLISDNDQIREKTYRAVNALHKLKAKYPIAFYIINWRKRRY